MGYNAMIGVAVLTTDDRINLLNNAFFAMQDIVGKYIKLNQRISILIGTLNDKHSITKAETLQIAEFLSKASLALTYVVDVDLRGLDGEYKLVATSILRATDKTDQEVTGIASINQIVKGTHIIIAALDVIIQDLGTEKVDILTITVKLARVVCLFDIVIGTQEQIMAETLGILSNSGSRAQRGLAIALAKDFLKRVHQNNKKTVVIT